MIYCRNSPRESKLGVRKLNGEVDEKWIKIKYDYITKYCTTCKIQWHAEEQCYFLHPELFQDEKISEEENSKEEKVTRGKMQTTKQLDQGKRRKSKSNKVRGLRIGIQGKMEAKEIGFR